MSAKVVCWPSASWKLPKLSSAPAGIAAGLNVTVGSATGWRPPPRGLGWKDTTRKKPAGGGLDEQKRPTVTMAGMPSCLRSFWRVLGSSSTRGLMVSVAVPLALLTC
jgi:hypothetical protein